MLFCCHRINTAIELCKIPSQYGIEVDLRDNLQGEVYLAHDPFIEGELFDDFLKGYNHSFIILNIKSERIEYKVLELLRKYKITDYFFLDSSFPMIYKLSNEGENKSAVRFSEFEGLDTILNMKGKVEWVWVDCFTKNPLTFEIYTRLKDAGFKLCFVPPRIAKSSGKNRDVSRFFYKRKYKNGYDLHKVL